MSRTFHDPITAAIGVGGLLFSSLIGGGGGSAPTPQRPPPPPAPPPERKPEALVPEPEEVQQEEQEAQAEARKEVREEVGPKQRQGRGASLLVRQRARDQKSVLQSDENVGRSTLLGGGR